MSEGEPCRVVLITAPSHKIAEMIAKALVEERLAACVNILSSIRSVYRWEGKVCDDREELLIAKTRAGCLDRLGGRVRELHPYEVPEVIALPVEWGSSDYLSWVAGETR